MAKSRVPLRLDSPGRNERPEHWCYSCCLPGCRRLVALANDGYVLPCCLVHAEALPDRLFRKAERAARWSPYDPMGVVDGVNVVLAINAYFATLGERRRKARRR